MVQRMYMICSSGLLGAVSDRKGSERGATECNRVVPWYGRKR